MDGLMDDRAVARRVLEHIDAGTTDLGDEVWREPVENYRSPQRMARSRPLIHFARSPTVKVTGLPPFRAISIGVFSR